MATNAQKVRDIEEARARARRLRKEILSIQREQGLLVAEMVWNEMRAWELKEKLNRDAVPEGMDAAELRRDLALRLREIRGLALWEAGADRSLRIQSGELSDLIAAHPELEPEMRDLHKILARPELEHIARAAADELGLPLRMSAAAG